MLLRLICRIAGGAAMLQIAVCGDRPGELEIISAYITELYCFKKLRKTEVSQGGILQQSAENMT